MPHPDVVARRVDDEIVVVQLNRSHVFALNGTGARFWDLMVDGATPSDALERMLDEYDVSRAELRGEIEAFLDQLVSEELVTADGG